MEAFKVTAAGEPVPAEESEIVTAPDVLAANVAAADVTFIAPVDEPVSVNEVELLSFIQDPPVVLFTATAGALVRIFALLVPIAPLPEDRVKVPPVEIFVKAA